MLMQVSCRHGHWNCFDCSSTSVRTLRHHFEIFDKFPLRRCSIEHRLQIFFEKDDIRMVRTIYFWKGVHILWTYAPCLNRLQLLYGLYSPHITWNDDSISPNLSNPKPISKSQTYIPSWYSIPKPNPPKPENLIPTRADRRNPSPEPNPKPKTFMPNPNPPKTRTHWGLRPPDPGRVFQNGRGPELSSDADEGDSPSQRLSQSGKTLGPPRTGTKYRVWRNS